MIDNLINGFIAAATPAAFFYTFLGAMIGTAIGVLPGLGPAATIGLLLPITFGMDPLVAMAMLCGIYYGAQYGGSTTSILLNMPGEAASVITCIDGHEMAKQGRGGVALGISAIGSFAAGIVGTFGLMVLGAPLAGVALSFGPAEYTFAMLLGLSMATSLGGKNQIKAIIMCVLGLLVSSMGTDSFAGVNRFTFGLTALESGIDLVPILMGLFAFSEILSELEKGLKHNPELMNVSTRLKDLLPNKEDLKKSFGPIMRGSVGGFLISVLPGIGAATSSFMSYAMERKLSKTPEIFGTGAVEGVAGPETANNAASSGAMVPLFTLGIPGTATAAVLAGGMMMYGLVPGPLLFTEHPTFIYGLIATMFIGNVMLVVLNLPMIGMWVKVLKVPLHILYPVVVALVILGAFSVNFDALDLAIVGLFGVFGYVTDKCKFPHAPFILGFFLGPLFEASLRRAYLMGRGDPSVFFQSSVSLMLITAIAAVLLGPNLYAFIKRKLNPNYEVRDLRDAER